MTPAKLLNRFSLVFFCTLAFFNLQTCGSSKSTTEVKDYISSGPMVSYENDISPILSRSCAPCHFPDDGKKLPLNTYEAAKEHVDAILARVQLPEDNWKFMPYKNKKPSLTKEEIDMVKRWAGKGFAQ